MTSHQPFVVRVHPVHHVADVRELWEIVDVLGDEIDQDFAQFFAEDLVEASI